MAVEVKSELILENLGIHSQKYRKEELKKLSSNLIERYPSWLILVVEDSLDSSLLDFEFTERL